jgi:hypothetical protein
VACLYSRIYGLHIAGKEIVMFLQIMRVLIIVSVIGVSTQVEAEDWVIRDIYGGTTPLLIQPKKPINLKFEKESNGIEYKEKEKTLREDLDEFIKENLFTYTMLWSARGMYDPENVRMVFTLSSIPKWLHNITEWQNCNQAKFEHHRCSPASKPFWTFPLWDGDAIHTNLVQHPIFGSGTYLYYRQMEYDRAASSLASFELSALYEYTVEGWMQSPSITDLIVTPSLGVLSGITLEETSNLLAKSDSQFIRALSYVVNPAKIVIRDGQLSWSTVLSRTITFQFSW